MKRVLVARVDSAGDVLLSGPAVRAVAASGAEVVFLAGPRGRAAAGLLPGVAAVVVRHIPWIDPEPEPVTRESMLALVDELADLRVDEAVVLTSFHQSPLPLALLLRLAGVPTIAAVSDDYPGSLLDVRHRVDEELHEVERALSLVATLGHRLPGGDDGRLAVSRPLLGRNPVAELAPYVVVHPGCSVPARTWAPDRFRALVELLGERGRGVDVTVGPVERELNGFVAAGAPHVVDLGGETTLAELVEVVADAEAIVVGNTGPAHVAAAVATPVVSLFAPTVPPGRWAPWRVPVALLGDHDIECAGCRARVCPFEGHPCLGAVSVEDAAAALERVAPRAHAVVR